MIERRALLRGATGLAAGLSVGPTVVTAVGAAVTAWPALALAHAPSKHNARLVAFNRPQSAPDFTLPGLDGAPISLSQLQGRAVLLNFWATWCPPCVAEMPSMERLSQRFADRPLVVLGVSLDAEGADKVRPFVAKRVRVTYPIALDPASRVSSTYGARDLPSSFLIDAQGRVVAAAKGERQWDAPEIVSFIEELLAGGT